MCHGQWAQVHSGDSESKTPEAGHWGSWAYWSRGHSRRTWKATFVSALGTKRRIGFPQVQEESNVNLFEGHPEGAAVVKQRVLDGD